MKKRFAAIIISIIGLLMLTACGNSSSNGSDNNDGDGDGKKYKVGISVFADHPSLNRATEGFKQALKDAGLDVEYDEQNALGETNNTPTIAKNLVGAGVDLIFANATPSAQAVKAETDEIPIIFTSVTDPVGAKLVDSMENPGGNVTGTADMHPDAIPNTINFIVEEMDGVKAIGTIYNAGEQNSVAQVNIIKESLNGTGVELVEASAANTSEVKQAADSLVGNVDVIFIFTDNTVVSALESVISVAEEHDIPLFVGEHDSVKRGGFAAYGFDYYDIGYEAGELAVKILKDGKKPSELPAQYPQKLTLLINPEAAEKMGVEIKDKWKDMAEFLE